MSDLAAALSVPSSGFRLDSRFGGTIAADLTMRRPNVAEGAYSEGYAKGFEDGTATAVAQAEQDSAARSRIELGLGRLAEEEERRFEERLRETVLALCEKTLAPLTADPDILAGRVVNASSISASNTPSCSRPFVNRGLPTMLRRGPPVHPHRSLLSA